MHNSFSRSLLFMLAAPLIWAAHFLFIYSVNGIACARPALMHAWAGIPISSWIILGASLLALAAMAAIYVRGRTQTPATNDPGFLPWVAGMLALLSAVAVIWETMPVLLLPACS